MRVRILSIIIFACFGLLFAGLFYLQIVRGSYYLEQSRSNSIRIMPLEAPRGKIYDRNGTLLVTNRISFDVAVIPQELRDSEKSFLLLSDILNIPTAEIKDSYKRSKSTPFVPAVIRSDIDKKTALRLEEARLCLPGIMLQARPLRHYVYNEIGSHIFGYLGYINREELSRLKNYGYQRQDLIGRGGLEKCYDSYLRGRDGGSQVEVDNRGRNLRVLGIKEPVGGKDIHLTIDIKLQKFIEEVLNPFHGAVIIMNPANGEILALASKPNFDPNIFIGNKDRAAVGELLNRADSPLLNRAISGQYQPGSIFKIVVALAALERKKIRHDTFFECHGSYAVGKRIFNCWKKKGHGSQEITDGLKNSCNVFFYQLGRLVGVDGIVEFAYALGYGSATGIDLTGEISGSVPNRMWKMMAKHEAWYDGDTVNLSIGQGYLLVTPIQVLKMMAEVANGGRLVRPHLVKRISLVDVSTEATQPIRVSAESIGVVKKGLYKVVQAEDGTGKYAQVPGLVIAGKTGTAQTAVGKTHAWFSGFSPTDNPSVCVLVFLEYGGKGGAYASEIAGKIFTELKQEGYL